MKKPEINSYVYDQWSYLYIRGEEVYIIYLFMKNLNDISIFNYSIDNHKTFDIIERSTN